MTTDFLAVQKDIAAIREMYSAQPYNDKLRAILYGRVGSGKTTTVGTAPYPILLHSFDPGGEKVLKPLIDSGKVVVQTFYDEDPRKPTQFESWRNAVAKAENNDWFGRVFKTYCVDSITMLSEAALNLAVIKHPPKTKDGLPDQGTYKHQIAIVRDNLKYLTSLPCHVILTGHITSEKDELTGRVHQYLLISPSLRSRTPMVYDELWVMDLVRSSTSSKRWIVTDAGGELEARTRIGAGGKLADREEPDITAILKKCGMDWQAGEVIK